MMDMTCLIAIVVVILAIAIASKIRTRRPAASTASPLLTWDNLIWVTVDKECNDFLWQTKEGEYEFNSGTLMFSINEYTELLFDLGRMNKKVSWTISPKNDYVHFYVVGPVVNPW